MKRFMPMNKPEPLEKKEKKKKHYFSAIFMIGLVFATFLYLLKDVSISEIFHAVKKANPFYLSAGLMMMFLFIACEALILHIGGKTLHQSISMKNCMNYSFIGFYFSSITPSSTGGQPAQIYYMKKDHISISHSSLLLLLITSTYQFIMLIYGILMYFMKYAFLDQHMKFIKWLFLFGIAANGASAAFLLIIVFGRNLAKNIVLFFLNIFCKIKVVKDRETAEEKVNETMEEYKKGAEYIKKNPMLLVSTLFITIIQLTALYCIPYFVYRSFGLHSNSLLDIIAVQAVLSLSVSSVPLPGAVGASESGFMMLYRILFSSGLILPAMLLSRGISFYLFLFVSGGITLWVHIQQNKSSRNRISVFGSRISGK